MCAMPTVVRWIDPMFICPTTPHNPDPLWADQPDHPLPQALGVTAPDQVVPAPQLWDFLSPQYLDYGYIPSKSCPDMAGNEAMDPQTPIVADSNPYIRAALMGQPRRGGQQAKQLQSPWRWPERAVR